MKRHVVSTVLAAVVLAGSALGGLVHAQESGKDGATMQMQKPTGDGEMNRGKTMDMGMSQELGPADANYDLRFLNAMIEHHRGALTMAADAAAKSKRPEIQKLAKQIVAAQQKEISQMQAYRRRWYKQ